MQMKSFLSITLHTIVEAHLESKTIGTVELFQSHTAEYIGKTLVETLSNWSVQKENVVAVVTDSGANFKKAIINEFTANKHIPCVAHTINLVVEKAIEKTQEINVQTKVKSGGVPAIMSKIREIVKFVKRSSKASDSLRKCQKLQGTIEGKYLKPILDVRTRWNSSFYMIERFSTLAIYLSQVLLEFNGTDIPEMVSVSELNCLKEMCALLQSFEQLTRELSTEKTVMSSKVIPLIVCTKNELIKQDPTITITIQLKIKLIEELDFRCGAYEQGPVLPICTILDPRFKDMHFRNPLINARVQENILKMMDNDYNETNPTVPEETMNPPSELNQYLHRNVIKLNEDPLVEWKNTEVIYPKLYNLAMKYLLIPATSVPSERLFSKAGETVSKTRNRLTGKNLSKLLFLQSTDKNQLAHIL
ncbi:zinc finger BED domain-containing protein 4-like [Acyrthosiphon pisum]|uniref:HAT C-terminal dimerisation domain-containing protein n=1 Tax=Acyrthosiphon pisum TaxID=7029 RepID=A0A8R2BBJ8_ACYPI|nr:zinc finger BED domain-containing protein 4-like [Acyrthosiphon pisum]|eukprot:XP_008189831.1 PREDICTED: zinc finger BED domain-containing protein 4-like [Acyrthosiphon pisum]